MGEATSRWNQCGDVPRGDVYDNRWRRLEESGQWPHGEADLVCWFKPSSVLDAGCGTGRVAIELDRRGIDVVGVDLDAGMLNVAHEKAPHLRWLQDDLATVTVDRLFDVVVMAGNVIVFVVPGSEAQAIANMARHLRPCGHLVTGFQLAKGPYSADEYKAAAEAAGLELAHEWSTWARDSYTAGDYIVLVHQLPLLH